MIDASVLAHTHFAATFELVGGVDAPGRVHHDTWRELVGHGTWTEDRATIDALARRGCLPYGIEPADVHAIRLDIL